MAQDIIHTYDSAPIKAKILEIGDDYMYYKTWDNPNGPLYNMSLSRVMKIVFENGSTSMRIPLSALRRATAICALSDSTNT